MIKCILLSKRHRKKKKYTPYNFDEKIEYAIYSNIGERHKREFMGKKSKVDKKYPDFDKYTEWKTYFEKKFLNGISNKYDFKRYLNRKLRIHQRDLEICKSLAIPIYICETTVLITLCSTAYKDNIERLSYTTLFNLILILIIGFVLIHRSTKKINFFKDCINIIESEDTSHQ